MISAWYGSSRLLVVGPAAFTTHSSPSFNITGPQWYNTDPRISTGGGFFIRCACTASRPVNISPLINTTSPTFNARTCSSVSGARRITSLPVRGKPSPFAILVTGRAGSRYSHLVMAPLDASSLTPNLRYAQQSYATLTKKLAGRRFAAVILHPISEDLPPNPIAPTPILLASSMISASSLAKTGFGFVSSSVRNN